MKKPAKARRGPSETVASRRASSAADASRAARENDETRMTPGERLTLALELSDLCEKLAAAGRSARKASR